ncbi:hypothetical protein ZWY2020_054005 [Hordeum vulgare]|nr:hypothetical protein ZWY2020_054005 [Hordeum vulgare]
MLYAHQQSLTQLGMAPHKTMTRTVRHYAPASQRRRRVPVEEMEFVDGDYLSIEVSADLVLPRAKTRNFCSTQWAMLNQLNSTSRALLNLFIMIEVHLRMKAL